MELVRIGFGIGRNWNWNWLELVGIGWNWLELVWIEMNSTRACSIVGAASVKWSTINHIT
jgi:hypothetical protein